MLIRFSFLVGWLLLSNFSVLAADVQNKEKYTDIKRLIELTTTANISNQFASGTSQSIFEALKKARPDIPDRTAEVINRDLQIFFKEKINAAGGLIEKLAPIYDKHFSHAEVKELIVFYQTAVGKKIISVFPKIVSESVSIEREWAQSLRPEIGKRVDTVLDKEGIIPLRK